MCYQSTCKKTQHSHGKNPPIYSSSACFYQTGRAGEKIVELKIRTPGFCFHVGPWAVVEGGVLNPEAELHLLSSPSSHSYQLLGLGRVPSCGTWLFVHEKSFSALPKHTLRLHSPGSLQLLWPCGWIPVHGIWVHRTKANFRPRLWNPPFILSLSSSIGQVGVLFQGPQNPNGWWKTLLPKWS